MGNAVTVSHQMASPRNSNYMIVIVYKYNNTLVLFEKNIMQFKYKYSRYILSCGKSSKVGKKGSFEQLHQ